MKNIFLGSVVVVASIGGVASDLTAQEQAVVSEIRKMYVQQTGHEPTPEEELTALNQWRASVLRTSIAVTRLQGLTTGSEPVESPSQQQTSAQGGAAISEDVLTRKMDALGAGKSNLDIEGARDGLKIGGVSYLDPEGPIKAYAFDVLTGDISYSIRSGDGFAYKYMRAGADSDPMTFASAHFTRTGWQVTTVSGKQLSGDTVVPLAKGLMVSRAGSVFRYEPGKGINSAAVPDGWIMAQFQRGNVGATHYVLVERIQPPGGASGGLSALLGSMKALGASLGLSKKEDYALMHLDSGKLYPLNVQVDGKLRSVMSNCRKRNCFVNECATNGSYEALYTDTGRNFGHYYWKADWYSTPAGPLAVTMENGVADVYILDLASGKKVTAFHRAMGIASVDVMQKSDGAVVVSANWMMSEHRIEDAARFLDESVVDADETKLD